jgi:hypothetical protein
MHRAHHACQESPVQIQIVLFLAFAGVALFYGQAMKRKRAASMGPAFRNFLQRTGYRYAELGDAPLEQQAAHGEAVMRDMAKGFRVHMVRHAHGLTVHHHQAGHATDTGWCSSLSWSLPLAAPPRAVLQIADKSLAGFGKLVKEAFSNTRRTWTAAYPVPVAFGDPELDRRLVCYAEDGYAAQQVLATPGLKERLLACAEVDLVVSRAAITFSDPFMKNLNAGLGSAAGRMAMGGDVNKMMELQVPVHDRIAELLAITARAIG